MSGVLPLTEVHDLPLAMLAPHLPTLAAVLDAAETAKAVRYLDAAKGDESRCCRGVLRHLLGVRLGIAPAALRFAYGPAGKPLLPDHPRLHINLSHGAGRCLIGLADRPIGVDVQGHDERCDIQRLAARWLHPLEQAQLAADSDPGVAFFHAWARKEAVIKADGRGLGLDLTAFAVDLRAARAPLRHCPWPELAALVITDLPLGPACSAACAVTGAAPALWTWDALALDGLLGEHGPV